MLSGAGRGGIRAEPRLRAGAAQLFLHCGALAPAGTHPRRRCRTLGADHIPCRHGGRGRAGRRGRLAAATSTGGMTGKRYQPHRRFAHHRRGHLRGRPLLRRIGHRARGDIHSRRRGARYLRANAFRRAHLDAGGARSGARGASGLGGEGGVIAIDRRGEIAMEFNSEGMFRASRRERRRSAESRSIGPETGIAASAPTPPSPEPSRGWPPRFSKRPVLKVWYSASITTTRFLPCSLALYRASSASWIRPLVGAVGARQDERRADAHRQPAGHPRGFVRNVEFGDGALNARQNLRDVFAAGLVEHHRKLLAAVARHEIQGAGARIG